MPLTRPLINNLNTNVEIFNESMTVLHGNSTQANVDIGFVMNRAMGLVPNSAFYWNEGSQSFYFAMTANAGITYSNITPSSYANVTVGNVLFVNGAGLYVNGSLGTAGQVLGSNGTTLSWVSGGGFNGGTITNLLTINNTAVSTSTTTGALIVTGGAGIAGDVNIGGNVAYGAVSILNGSSTTTSIGTTPKSIDSFATATYRGAKYLISTTDVTNTQYQMAEVILTQDGTNVGISVYGISYTGVSSRMTFTANITSGTLTLWGTGVSANNTVKLQRTLIPA